MNTPSPSQLARAANLADRGCRKAALGDTSAAWSDLGRARQLAGDSPDVLAARQILINDSLSEAERLLREENTDAALAKLNRLHSRNISGGKVGDLRQVLLKTRRAQRLARVGRFSDAAEQLAAAGSLRKDLTVLNRRRVKCRQLARQSKKLSISLNLAQQRGDWQRVMNVADELLAIAPENPRARDARTEAWENLSVQFNDSGQPKTESWHGQRPATLPRTRWSEIPAVAEPSKCPNQRLLLWVDAVGGFLVCLADEVLLGQAVPGATADVAIYGDVSREHATIRRDDGGYVLEPIEEVVIDGERLAGPHLLADGEEIQLGQSVRYRFRQPHPLSSSARLEPLSRHRTQPAADSVLLMAESCVLGPKLANHIVAPDWNDDVVLFRQEDQLHCRGGDDLQINGQTCDGRGRVTHGALVSGADFSFTVEELS